MTPKEVLAFVVYVAELWEQVPLWSGGVDDHAVLFLGLMTARYRGIIRMRGAKIPARLRNLPHPAPIVPLRSD